MYNIIINDVDDMKKRIVAYILDIILVSMISSLISMVPFINVDYNKYKDKFEEYNEEIKNFEGLKSDFNTYTEDYELSLDEYENLINDYPKYADYLTSKYDELNLLTDKLDDDLKIIIILEITDINKDILLDYSYNLCKLEFIPSIINIVCIIVYFVFVQYFLNGQTLGKRIVSIKVVRKDENRASILNLLIRTVVLMGIVFTTCNLVCLQLLSKSDYLNIFNYISYASYINEFLIFATSLVNNDNRGLHDLLGNTKVVPVLENTENVKIIDSEIV